VLRHERGVELRREQGDGHHAPRAQSGSPRSR
jgi:hypothetical protein